MKMKLELIKKEMIKPATKTPDHPRTVQLSFLDQFLPPMYVAGIFFYNKEENHVISEDIVSSRLKKSLSETLIRFYPLAGRIKGVSIDCNDEGAVFMEARADCLLSEFLSNADPDSLGQFVPSEFLASGEPPETWPLLNIKVTFFRSGGLAIAVCLTHKICDAASFTTFVHGWAATAKGYVETVSPEFTASTIYPPAGHSFQTLDQVNENLDNGRKCITKRFVFDASKIPELKLKAESESVRNPTRVEAITSLIWRCAAKASRSNSTASKPTAMMVAMDLRRRSQSAHLNKNTMGNLLTSFLVKEGPESEIEPRDIVAKLRKKKEEVNEIINEHLQGNTMTAKFGEKMVNLTVNLWSELSPKMDIYTTTSWCRLPFYEVDFGWGNPMWVTPGSHTIYKNTIYLLLLDTKDGEGIEAWVSLPEQDMLKFEHDQELLALTSPNPSVII